MLPIVADDPTRVQTAQGIVDDDCCASPPTSGHQQRGGLLAHNRLAASRVA
jgi:hypothetical protein